ncbi:MULTISPECIES: hypothetical protein [Flavobacterium]|uniref:hypothetical protein n=1 Tax=Flavobacterium TaxID=237 RepID=UPI001FCC857D|nr:MULTISPECIES: hypothetical protein [Flavobacterium]UOK41621.1 hypothetical protein LZF87_09890 [Flavobacterium enshiense]
MKKLVLTLFIFSALVGCEHNKPKDLNVKFTYVAEGASATFKNQFTKNEKINTQKTEKGIEITVDKYVTGIPYYGKAEIINDTLILNYWTNIDSKMIPSVIIPSRFKYEILDVPYKEIKFNYLGNKYKNKE